MSAQDLSDARVVVLGVGRFGGGLGAALWLAEQGASVLATDRSPRAELGEAPERLEDAGVEVLLGGHAGLDWRGVDLLVLNPAVPPDAAPVLRAREAGVPLSSEIALLMERWPGPMLGVTGSNGKSTTVGLLAGLLEASGRAALPGGNLGGSLLARLDSVEPGTAAVLELSSFMLDALPQGLPPVDVAVITNLTPNHLDRHGDMDAYVAAKARLLEGAGAAVLRADQPEVAALAERLAVTPRWFGLAGSGADLELGPTGGLVDGEGQLRLEPGSSPLPGAMNLLNVAAATLAVEALLQIDVQIQNGLPKALRAHPLPPHRLQLVVERAGVRWIDDSVSTTPESTAASLQALGAPCLLIAGGRDKGLDPESLIEAATRHARCVLTVGEQGAELAHRLNRAGILAEQVDTISSAVSRAAELAREGEVVLLSPGFSSHDQFAHFEARAECFVAEVGRLGTEC